MNRRNRGYLLGLVAVIGVILVSALVLRASPTDRTATQTSLPIITSPVAAPTAMPPAAPSPTIAPPTATPLAAEESPQQYSYGVVNTYPHDPEAFTQGLIYADGIFYEGTGLRGRSSLRKVDPTTGEVLQRIDLAPEFFGEGITLFGDRIIQLTWQANVGFVYNKDSLERLGEWQYPTEGWGITHDGTRLIMSDGTANLYFRDPETFAEIGRVEVRDNTGPVVRLNELEYINGEVFANVWQTDRIARIDPQTGQVTGWIDLTGLLSPEDRQQNVDVLNGIAYDPATDRLFVTGKLWPKLFEIELVPASDQ